MSRRRFRYDRELGQVVEVDPAWTGAETRAPVATEALVYGSAGRATDGTDISTRAKHQAYLKANGLALASDYTETWQRADKQRQDFFAGRHEHSGLKQAIGRAVDAVRGRKR